MKGTLCGALKCAMFARANSQLDCGQRASFKVEKKPEIIRRRAEGTCSAHRLVAMRRRPPTFDTDPAEVVTLEIEVPPDVAGSAQRVLLLEDRDDFREVLRDHLVS